MPRHLARPQAIQHRKTATAHSHTQQPALTCCGIGLQAPFRNKQPPATCRCDRARDPQLSWDIHAEREHAEALIAEIEREGSSFKFPVSGRPPTEAEWQRLLQELETRNSKLETLARELRAMSRPFLNWVGKGERHTFTVPALPLFVHERLSTEAILRSVPTHNDSLGVEP